MASPLSARKDGTNYIHSTTPDVCLTPMGSSLVPVAYNSVCFFCEEAVSRSSITVRDNENHDFQLNSRCTKTIGHEPGTGKGIKVPGYMSVSHAKSGSAPIYSEGFSIVNDGSPGWINRPDEGSTEAKRISQKISIKYF